MTLNFKHMIFFADNYTKSLILSQACLMTFQGGGLNSVVKTIHC